MEHTATTRHQGPYTRECAEGGLLHRVPDEGAIFARSSVHNSRDGTGVS